MHKATESLSLAMRVHVAFFHKYYVFLLFVVNFGFSVRVYYVLSRVPHYRHVVAMLQGAGAATQPRQGQE